MWIQKLTKPIWKKNQQNPNTLENVWTHEPSNVKPKIDKP
jgi:hypothetical protein